jgi:hypothetical protein
METTFALTDVLIETFLLSFAKMPPGRKSQLILTVKGAKCGLSGSVFGRESGVR